MKILMFFVALYLIPDHWLIACLLLWYVFVHDPKED